MNRQFRSPIYRHSSRFLGFVPPVVISLSVLLAAGCSGSGTTPPTSTPNEWAWMSGSDTGIASGVYGTQGAASKSDVPGAREGAASWTDSSGNLWLFGGAGLDSDALGYVTRKQAAAMLSCSDQTISKLHKAGRLPFYYLGRHAVRIKVHDISARLSANPT